MSGSHLPGEFCGMVPFALAGSHFPVAGLNLWNGSVRFGRMPLSRCWSEFVEWFRSLWQRSPVGLVEWFRSLKVGCPTRHGLTRTCQGGSPPPPWRPRLPRTSPPLRGALHSRPLPSGRARRHIHVAHALWRLPCRQPSSPGHRVGGSDGGMKTHHCGGICLKIMSYLA